jgi:hypothetical protein
VVRRDCSDGLDDMMAEEKAELLEIPARKLATASVFIILV